MSFPLPPNLPLLSGTPQEFPPTDVLAPDQVPFTLFFGLETNLEEQATHEDIQVSPAIEETVEPPPVEVDEQQDNVPDERPPETPTMRPERHPQTLVESTFSPVNSLVPTTKTDPKHTSEPQQKIMGSNPSLPKMTTSAEASKTVPAAAPLKAETPKIDTGAPAVRSRPEIVELQQKNSAFQPVETRSATDVSVAASQTTPLPLRPPKPQTAQPIMTEGTRLSSKEVQPRFGNFDQATITPIQSQKTPVEISQAPIGPTQSAVTNARMPFAFMASEAETPQKLGEVPITQGFGESLTNSARAVVADTGQVQTQPYQMAKSVANQLAVAVSQSKSGSTELILSPEELGRVRMVMSTQDGGISVLIQTERPETNDLLRRHIEVLSQEFKNMGYSTASFTFGQDKQQQSDEEANADEAKVMQLDDTSDIQTHRTVAASEGLDLRL